MNKKNILIVNIGTNLGGIESSLSTFCKTLNVLGFSKPTLATWKSEGAMMSQISPFIRKFIKLGVGSLNSILKQKWRFNSILQYIEFKIRQLLKKDEWKACDTLSESYDIAICYCQNGYSPYYVIDKVKAAKKILWYHHGSYEKQGRAKQKDLSYYLKYDTIVTVSEANRAMLLSHFPELAKKIVVIKNIIDKEDIVKKSQQTSDEIKMHGVCNIATVGRIAPEKGQTFALKVAKELKNRGFGFHWFFVGDGPDKIQCLSLIKEYNIESSCSFIGAKSNPYPFINQADMYVQTSSIEADPITIAEAKVLRKPIIASDIPPIREALGNGQFGTLCALNPQTFADRIIDIFNNKNEHATASTNFYDSTTDNAQQLALIHNLLNQ